MRFLRYASGLTYIQTDVLIATVRIPAAGEAPAVACFSCDSGAVRSALLVL